MDQLKPPPAPQAPVTDDRGAPTTPWIDFVQSLYDELRRQRVEIADLKQRVTDLEP